MKHVRALTREQDVEEKHRASADELVQVSKLVKDHMYKKKAMEIMLKDHEDIVERFR